MASDSLERYRRQTPEVLLSESPITAVDRQAIEELKANAESNPRKRIRLCTHGDSGDLLHEMLIVHEQGAYVRPHRHPGKSESMHVIEGEADLVVLDDEGEIQGVTALGDYASGRTFFHRMAAPLFHTLIVRSRIFVFHETTNGPFDRADTVFAPWAPDDADPAGVNSYLQALNARIEAMR